GDGGILAVSARGHERVVATPPADFILYDIAKDGRVLLGKLVEAQSIWGSFPGESRPRDLSYFNSGAFDLSANGETLLFYDVSRGGSEGAVYLRKTDGSPPKRLEEVTSNFDVAKFSPDARTVVAEEGGFAECAHAVLPVGAGQPRRLKTQGIVFT